MQLLLHHHSATNATVNAANIDNPVNAADTANATNTANAANGANTSLKYTKFAVVSAL